jgi:hypothetical protein
MPVHSPSPNVSGNPKKHPTKMNRLLSILIFTCFITTESCNFGVGAGEARITPTEFLNETKVSQFIYDRDKDTITHQIQHFLFTHDKSFYSQEYFDSTILTIDTILYSPDQSRIAVFLFTKNPITRQTHPNTKYKYYYDASCYLGKRQKDTFDLKWLDRFRLINFYNPQEVTNGLRNLYFTEFATLKNVDNTYTYNVNLDDKRFWNCYAWMQYFKE